MSAKRYFLLFAVCASLSIFNTAYSQDDPPAEFEYNQSSQQAFYFLQSANIESVELAADDWIAVFKNGVCVGAAIWEGLNTTLTAQGDQGEDWTVGYLVDGDIPDFVVYDASEGIFLDQVMASDVHDINDVPISLEWHSGGPFIFIGSLDAYIRPLEFIFNQSSLQANYFIISAVINTSEISTDDWIGIFNGDICVGAAQWAGEWTLVPAMGDNGLDWTVGYMESGGIPSFQIWDASIDSIFTTTETTGVDPGLEWANLAFINIDQLAAITVDCNGDDGGSAILDECGNCVEGSTGLLFNYAMDCLGVCEGTAVEDCAGVCDGSSLEDDFDGCCEEFTTFYADTDIDTFGDLENSIQACDLQDGYVANSNDCDDTNVNINPDATDANCDGVDDNCNDVSDDQYGATATVCGVGVCESNGVLDCIDGFEIDSCVEGDPTGDDTDCNGFDEDCSGTADDNYVAPDTECGEGVCFSTGILECIDGSPFDTCEEGLPAGDDTDCNGIDEDCSGGADDNYVTTDTECGEGVCFSTGILECIDGGEVDSCVEGDPTGLDDDCNGIDEDCSGTADDNYLATDTECGEGVCFSTGTLECIDGGEVDSCVVGDITGLDDDCNGFDEDCSGTADDNYVSTSTECGEGVCFSTGSLECIDGSPFDTCEEGLPTGDDTDCNGVDEDCAGGADDNYLAAETECGVGVCIATGFLECVDGGEVDSCVEGDPAGDDTDCDGLDDDCSGAADDNYVATATVCGVGVCESIGVLDCIDGNEENSCVEGEITGDDTDCNGLDDDCSGFADDNYIIDDSCFVAGDCVIGNVESSCIDGTPTECLAGEDFIDECSGECCDGDTGIECSYFNAQDDFSGYYDCAGVCDGFSYEDPCGTCDDDPLNDCTYSYFEAVYDTIPDNGTSQLIIFDAGITSLSIGDEIAIFDAAGLDITNIENCNGNIGEVMVASGTYWGGVQTEMVATGSIDNCAFGGSMMPGWISGNSIVIRVYKHDEEIEYETVATYNVGNGVFGDIFTSVGELTLVEDQNIVINEFFFRNSNSDVPDYIELYNTEDVAVDLAGWTINGETIVSGIIDSAGYFLLATEDPFYDANGTEYFAGENLPNSAMVDISLGTSSDGLILVSAVGAVVDEVSYNIDEWPTGSINSGYAVELKNEDFDNSLAGNWGQVEETPIGTYMYLDSGDDWDFGSPLAINTVWEGPIEGCMDSQACTYDPLANINVPEDCLYDAIYYADVDGDGFGAGVGEIFCPGDETPGWVSNTDDPEPDCPNITPDILQVDDCGVCICYDEDNEFCEPTEWNEDMDCAGECFGPAVLDDCLHCSGGNSGHIANSEIDECNVCPEGYLAIDGTPLPPDPEYIYLDGPDCLEVCFGDAEFDACDICEGGNEEILPDFCVGPDCDCEGVCFGDAELATFCLDTDGDGLGNPGTEYEYCEGLPDGGYVPNCDDEHPDCFENFFDCLGECGGPAIEDCADECNGNAQIEVFCIDEDQDGYGAFGSETEYCDTQLPDPDLWITDCTDQCDDIFGIVCTNVMVVEIDPTGISQLIIFENTITGLIPGDEVGIFDLNGLDATNEGNCEGNTGEVMVGAGLWEGDQLNIAAIGSVDNCAFGATMLPGYVNGNSIVVRVYRPSDDIIYDTNLTFSIGNGVYGDIFSNISEITFAQSYDVVINEFFFRNQNSDAPDYVELYNNETENVDLAGWTFNGEVISSGTISAGGYFLISIDDPFYDVSGEDYFAGVDFPNSAFADISLGTSSDELVLVANDGTPIDEVNYSADAGWPTGLPNRGYAVELISPTLDNSLLINWARALEDPVGSYMYNPTGDGWDFGSPLEVNTVFEEDVTEVLGCPDVDACNFNPEANIDDGSCEYDATYYADVDGDGFGFGDGVVFCGNPGEGWVSNNLDQEENCWNPTPETLLVDDCGVCNGENASMDCAGVCDGASYEDECGVCDDDPSNDSFYNSSEDFGGIYDCAGVCDGDSYFDECGVCDDLVENDNADMDCLGVCYGPNLEDECGTCDDDTLNDCIQDCAGVWGGESYPDECGVCDDDPANDSYWNSSADFGGVYDCAGDCFGALIVDDCGICDGDGSSCDTPIVLDQSLFTDENTALDFALTALDVDPLEFLLVVDPLSGSLECTDGTDINCTYTPNTGFSGIDQFQYQVFDGTWLSNLGTVTITVNSISSPPVAESFGLELDEDQDLLLYLIGSSGDVDDDMLEFQITSFPSNGDLSADRALESYTYSPFDNYNGSDSFTYTVFDGNLTSEEATVDLNILPMNDAPIIESVDPVGDSFEIFENTFIDITVNVNEVDGDDFTLEFPGMPVNGELTYFAGQDNFIYTPTPGFSGGEVITVQAVETATGDLLASAPAVIEITILPIEHTPIAYDVIEDLFEDSENFHISLIAIDPDGDAIEFFIDQSPDHGLLNLHGDYVEYSPDENYNGTDEFTYYASDGSSDSDPATVHINVIPVNDPPDIADENFTDVSDGFTFNLPTTDIDGDDLSVTFIPEVDGIGLAYLGGTVTPLGNGEYMYNVANNMTDWDMIFMNVTDGEITVNASIQFNITGGLQLMSRDAPNALDQSVDVTEDVVSVITLIGVDIGFIMDNTATVQITQDPINGSISVPVLQNVFVENVANWNLNYTPNGDFFGSDSIKYQVTNPNNTDGNTSGEGTVLITVHPVNDIPSLTVISNTAIDEDTQTTLTMNGTDPDNTLVMTALSTDPSNLTLEISGLDLTLVPAANYNGAVVVTATVTEADGDDNYTAVQSFTLTIDPINDTPVMTPVTDISMAEEGVYNLSMSASDIDGDNSFTYNASSDNNSLISLAIDGNQLTITGELDMSGTATVTANVDDGGNVNSQSESITFDVTVNNTNDAPLVNVSTPGAVNEDGANVVLNFTPSDADDDQVTITYSYNNDQLFPEGSVDLNLSVGDSGTARTITMNPAENASGTAILIITADDGSVTSSEQVTITVNATNDAPEMVAIGNQNVNEDQVKTVALAASDADNLANELTFSVTAGTNITASVSGNELTLTPDANYNGSESFTVTVTDGTNEDSSTFLLTVDPVPDSPVITSTAGIEAVEGIEYTYQVVATDVDEESLEYSLSSEPAGMAVDGLGLITWTPADGISTSGTVTLTVADPGGLVAIENFTISVSDVDCNGLQGGTALEDDCGDCVDPANFNDAMDCNGVCDGTAVTDNCGDCVEGDTGLTFDGAMDCNGVCDGTAVTDECSNCVDPSDFNEAMDCNGDCDGTALTDDCGDCVEGNTGITYNEAMDCAGVCDGVSYEDDCGICDNNVDNDNIDMDCDGVCFGPNLEDECLTCDDDPLNDCVQDCAGIWGGTAYEDECDVCDDDPLNDCVQDCAGDWGGDAYADLCGICDDDPLNDSFYIDQTNFGGAYDCNEVCEGDWVTDDCDDCVDPENFDEADLGCGCDEPAAIEYCHDTDSDGNGNPGTQTEYCADELPFGWVVSDSCDDPDPDCATDDTDDCGVCAGNNADMDCDGVCFGNSLEDMCNTCDNNPDNDCEQDCAGVWGGDSLTDDCGICDNDPLNDNADMDCAGVCFGDSLEDNCGVCDNDPLNDDADMDCAGVCFGSSLEDMCGVCDNNPDNDCEQDCADVWGGDSLTDNCGVCDNDPLNDDADMDCAGVCFGSNLVDECGVCDDDDTNDCIQDCNDVWGGDSLEDACGVCDNNPDNDNLDDGSGFITGPDADCAGVCDGLSLEDECGDCDDDDTNNCVQDCNGTWGGSFVMDDCSDCVDPADLNGAMDCNGVCDGLAVTDDCGDCVEGDTGADFNDAMDCAGVCDGLSLVDECGVCDDDDTNNCTQDCADVWGGDSLEDACGVCDNNPDNDNLDDGFGFITGPDADCAGICFGTSEVDECGVCDDDDTNDCEQDCNGTWGGSFVMDDCADCVDPANFNDAMDCTGLCDGTSIEDDCGDCVDPADFNAAMDCNDVCNGLSLEDDCGVCDEDPSNDNDDMDCAGVCFGTAAEDDCGFCDDDSSNDCALGCIDPLADNYDPDADTDDGSCTFTDLIPPNQFNDVTYSSPTGDITLFVPGNNLMFDGTALVDSVFFTIGSYIPGGIDPDKETLKSFISSDFSALQNVLMFWPYSIYFANPVEITIPYDISLSRGGQAVTNVILGLDSPSDNTWTVVNGSNCAAGSCSGSVNSFGIYTVATMLVDCNGTPGGEAYVDNCGICNDDPDDDCIQDCDGDWGGTDEIDDCGVCGGDNSCAFGITNFHVYPNPIDASADSYFYFETTKAFVFGSIKIFDFAGNEVAKISLVGDVLGEQNIQWTDMQGVGRGGYVAVLVLRDADGTRLKAYSKIAVK